MTPWNDHGQDLGQLVAPRRNNYFYGKLMDVLHFEMEQSYENSKRWVLNRLSLGQGVLCGLDVKAHDGQVCVTRGVAIDAFGREILVPVRMCIDPWELTDEFGHTKGHLAKDKEHHVSICLAYDECATDYTPVLVSDCNTRQDCAPGTIVESFSLLVHQGVPDAHHRDLCDALTGTAKMSVAAVRRQLCEELSGLCPTPTDHRCVVLATVKLRSDGTIGAIDTCTHRPVIYSNAVLLELILCLSERIEQCCKDTPALLRVKGVQFIDISQGVAAELSDVNNPPQFTASQDVNAIRIEFNRPVDPPTLITGGANADPETFSFLVQSSASSRPHHYLPGTVTLEPNNKAVRFTGPQGKAFNKADYTVTLFGNKDQQNVRPAVAGTSGGRLDGEPSQLPSGDGTEGGNFVFKFSVT